MNKEEEKDDSVMAVAAAATDFVNRISNETDYLFSPRYTDFNGGKRQQTNPHASLSEVDQTKVIFEGLTMVLGQLAASAFVASKEIKPADVYNQIFRRIRVHAEAYHQQFLHMRESQQDDKPNSDQRPKGGNVPPTANVSSQ